VTKRGAGCVQQHSCLQIQTLTHVHSEHFKRRRMSHQVQSDCIDIKPNTVASLDALAVDTVELTERTKWELY
jgi:hypothetical protein